MSLIGRVCGLASQAVQPGEPEHCALLPCRSVVWKCEVSVCTDSSAGVPGAEIGTLYLRSSHATIKQAADISPPHRRFSVVVPSSGC